MFVAVYGSGDLDLAPILVSESRARLLEAVIAHLKTIAEEAEYDELVLTVEAEDDDDTWGNCFYDEESNQRGEFFEWITIHPATPC